MVKDYNLNQIDAIAESLVAAFEYKIILLKGDLGAGKTTLVKAIVKQLGSNEEVSSPTFGIVNELNIVNAKVFHLDLYRIENSEELQQFGFEEYLHSGDYCFIEWPEIAMTLITQPHHTITLNNLNDSTRKISFI
jgi:tRNA threonylcarbamoyladenosine biosynthesis protein TsaE